MRLSPGTLVNGLYVVGKQLGGGYASQVYAAHTVHADWETPSFAIKFFTQAPNDQRLLARFRREFDLLWTTPHPHVVRCFDSGQHEGLPFIVLELARGCLADVLPANGFPAPQAAWAVFQAICGLKHVRAVHRDLKPDNLLIASSSGTALRPGDSEDGIRILVADWGLGRECAPASTADRDRLTVTADVVGTSDFMSPEQCLSSKHVGISSDIYALGCVLHMLASNRPLFPSEGRISTLYQHVYAPPSISPSIPQPLAGIIATCVRKDPAERFHSMNALQSALIAAMGLDGSWQYPHNPSMDLADQVNWHVDSTLDIDI